jgi:hypothetical protein
MGSVSKVISWIAAIFILGFTGCMELERKVTFYPDGSGKIDERQIFGERMIQMMKTMAKDKDIKEIIKDNLDRDNSRLYDFVKDIRITKLEKRYQVTQTGYFSDISKVFGGQAKIEKRDDGSFLLHLESKQKMDAEQLKRQRLRVGDFKIAITFIVPGEITGAKGFDSFRGRQAKLTINIDKLIKLAETGEAPVYQITFKAPTKEIEEEFQRFKKEYERLREEIGEEREEEKK